MVRKVECDEHAVIAARYANWESCARIAADYGVSRQCIYKILCGLPEGVPKRPREARWVRKIECDEHAVIAARYANWESCARIAADYGVSLHCIYKIVCDLPEGAPKRPSRPFPSRETALRLVAETGSVGRAAAALGVSRGHLSDRYPGLRQAFVDARNRRILEHVRGGASWAVAVRREGLSSASYARTIVERWAEQQGIALPRRKVGARAGEAHSLREEGLSWQAVAERLGYASAGSVRYAVWSWKRRTGLA